VSVVDDAEGVTISIRPSRFWRDRELHLSMLVVFGPLVSAMIGAPIAGGTGVVIGLVLTVMLGALAWLTAPTWRLRITHRGDFLLYARSPRRPKWVGTTKQLTVETTPTAKGDRIAYLRFRGGPEPVMMHFYPLGPGDAAALSRFGRSIQA
jgi:hypothetical protein